jgi:hypothetical protein
VYIRKNKMSRAFSSGKGIDTALMANVMLITAVEKMASKEGKDASQAFDAIVASIIASKEYYLDEINKR